MLRVQTSIEYKQVMRDTTTNTIFPWKYDAIKEADEADDDDGIVSFYFSMNADRIKLTEREIR
jgi:hypothetical protein